MTPTLHTLNLNQIDTEALPRDRTALDPQELDQLARSIALSGLRQPIEVWMLQAPRPPFLYGLISGYRRTAALRRLGLTEVQAFLRTPETLAQAMAEMVGENEIRSQITPWEKARLVLATVDEGHFPTPDAAIRGLFPHLSRQSHHRMRGHAEVVEALGDILSQPETLSSRRLDRLATALRSGWENLLRAALAPLKSPGMETQWQAMLPILTESTTSKSTGDSPRPRRLLHLKKGLTIRRELTQHGYALRFSGPEARRGGMMDDVMDYVERWFGSE
ncbi:ParB/RepB/Spo0J family partition protein [Pseudotabrizicola algicola]|uniref:ParB N-terminal domain-containing protein n=1 Tax=Pseudotabrizicola algicola TaxID=2709381 RepID=A0A6B3RR80_9RHOB|nr:ParB N-terminal domain-containing protein [Pseudotabrizicola algicola]NEX47961.1 ParB N-terminal domain-containing protein [Pseudotabrizicola algicola]